MRAAFSIRYKVCPFCWQCDAPTFSQSSHWLKTFASAFPGDGSDRDFALPISTTPMRLNARPTCGISLQKRPPLNEGAC